MNINSYKDLIVWQKSILLTKLIYQLTVGFPRDEVYGITAQMRRAAVSIPSNIAEGFGRRTHDDYKRFYRFAYASALELETQLLISKELAFGIASEYPKIEDLLVEVCKMLNKMSEKTSN